MLNSNTTKYSDIYIDGVNIYKYIRGEYHKLSQWIDNVEYYQVAFRIDGKRKYIRVHRLIAESLHLNRKTLSAILNHKKSNNYNYDFSYITERVSTNPDECTDVELEIGTSSKQETTSDLEVEDIVSADGDIR